MKELWRPEPKWGDILPQNIDSVVNAEDLIKLRRKEVKDLMAANVYNLEKRYKEEQMTTMQICISSYKNRVAKGSIIFLLDKTEIPFCGLDQMCLIMEEYLDRKLVFEERLEYRWICGSDYDGVWFTGQGNEPDDGFEINESETGYLQKFTIRIRERLNRSLQGELRVEQKKCRFRSGMELTRLMHQWLQMKYKASEKQDAVRGEPRRICNR